MAHQVVLTWTDTVNPTGTTYNVYRQAGSGPNTKIATGIAAKTYTDTDPALNIGAYTYGVTAVNSSIESSADTVTTNVPPAPPTGLTAVAS